MPRGNALLLGGQANGAVLRGNKDEGSLWPAIVERRPPSSDGDAAPRRPSVQARMSYKVAQFAPARRVRALCGWINYRVLLGNDRPCLHLSACGNQRYHTGTFAYAWIRGGFSMAFV